MRRIRVSVEIEPRERSRAQREENDQPEEGMAVRPSNGPERCEQRGTQDPCEALGYREQTENSADCARGISVANTERLIA